MAKFAGLVGAVPESKGWREYVDLVGVEEVVEGILERVLGAGRLERVKFVHHSGGQVVPTGEIGKVITRENGEEECKVLAMEESAAGMGEGLQIGQRLL